MSKYDHLFDMAFSVESDNDWEDITPEEFIKALDRRVADVKQMYAADPRQVLEVFGFLDTVSEED